MDNKISIKMIPKPPTALSKENLGVWNGWGALGDKEIAREAAAKGTHVDLAIDFLTSRKSTELLETKNWFIAEVLAWINELLERNQIFKASHILKNIRLDPSVEFTKVFCVTIDRVMREYIGNHLMKIDKLDENLHFHWNLLRSILQNSVIVAKYQLEINNIEYLLTQKDEWKAEIATDLFLQTHDPHLSHFITPEILWKHLLSNNDIKTIKLWINIKYNKEFEETDESSPILNLLRTLPINPDILNSNFDNVPIEMQDTILNEFSKFGIFREIEQRNLLTILQRLVNSGSIGQLYRIINGNNSVIKAKDFSKLTINYCLEHNFYSVLNWFVKDFALNLSKSKYLNLICDFRNLVQNFNEINLRDNIFNVADVLSCDVKVYFDDNPLLLLFLILLTKDVYIKDLIDGKSKLAIDNVILDIQQMQFKLPVLNAIGNKLIKGPKQCDLTVYDLLEKHTNIDASFLHNYPIDKNDIIPNFSNTKLIQNFGYCKKPNYKFYLKSSRPYAAVKSVLQEQSLQISTSNVEELKSIEKKVLKLAVMHFDCDEIVSSCVAFLEILNIDSLKLRVKIQAAKILLDSENDRNFIIELIFNSDDDPYTLQNILESTIIKEIDFEQIRQGTDFIKCLELYEIVVQFSKLNNLKLPELFLKQLASVNSWLTFLIFAQINDYPMEQVKLLVQFFKSPSMAEHLTHSVLNDIYIEEKHILIQERDSRNYLLSKIGMRKSVEIFGETLSFNSQHSDGSSNSSDLFEIDISNIKATLLQTLIRCHNSTDPPRALLQACQLYRNPILAIFATSYEPDSLITNWLTWVAVSCELCQPFTNYESVAVSPNAVTSLLEKCIKCCYPQTVHESFDIFLPDNPIKTFMEFILSLLKFEVNSTLMETKLQQFQKSLINTRKNSVINDNDPELTYLQNRIWIETTAMKLLSEIVNSNCNSLYEQIFIVDILNEIKIADYFTIETPDFHKLLEILKCLNECASGDTVRLEIDLFFDSKTTRQAIINCINSLLDNNYYKSALKVARIEQLPPDLILIKECQYLFENRSKDNFWQQCDKVFSDYEVTADCVVDFYAECAEKINNLLEKYLVLKLATDWAARYELSCQFELEKKMWLAFIHLDEKHRNLDELEIKSADFLYRDLTDILQTITEYDGELSKDMVKQIERIIVFILNKGNFWQALRLQKIFGCKSTDLETLKLSHSLAEGILLPYQLNAEQRLLLSNVSYLRSYSNRKTFLSTKFSSFSSSSHSPANSSLTHITSEIETPKNDTLAILKLLSEHLIHGIEIGHNIFMMYRISVNIEVPYQVVISASDYMGMLKDALDDNCMNKLDVVHDFLTVFKATKLEIADFICEELVTIILNCANSNYTQILLWDLDLDQEFGQILQLLQDNCSILGNKIFAYANTLHQTQLESNNDPNYGLIIELMIRAHDCFTADCNMQGISTLLKKSKELITYLLTMQDWKLIVRLLTGVARYTEMSYIFHILMENDQFEFLLRKGSCRDNAFKVALLEYLKKYCPDNRELYKIVALHFTLFSEVAMLWEKEAQSIIKNLISISKLEMQNNKLNPEEEMFVLLQNTEGTKLWLKKVIENYTHATEFHLQGEKLAKAAEAAKQAELVALQLSLLNDLPAKASATCILDLTDLQISTIISSKFNFEQSLILIEGYNYPINWATVLFEQYILKHDLAFFEGYLQHFTLTESMVYDISRKFINNNVNSVKEIRCMKRILDSLHSVHMKYKIASELGFVDLLENLLATAKLVYLKDTVWKRGYKS